MTNNIPAAIENILVVGAGPAGSSCAQWLRLLGFDPILVDASSGPGGLTARSPYPNQWISAAEPILGMQIAQNIKANIERHQIRFHPNASEVRVDFSEGLFRARMLLAGKPASFDARFVVLATGSIPKDPGLRGPNMAIGPGAPFEALDLRGKRLAVLGGGDNAGDAYIFAKARGASTVRVFSRSPPAMQASFVSAIGDDLVVGPYAASRADDSWSVAGESFDALAAMYGYAPRIPELGFPIALDAKGQPVAGAQAETSQPGLYAVGELTCRMHPCVATAMADGVVAAKDIEARLLGRK